MGGVENLLWEKIAVSRETIKQRRNTTSSRTDLGETRLCVKQYITQLTRNSDTAWSGGNLKLYNTTDQE